jgi:hypothetical protein
MPYPLFPKTGMTFYKGKMVDRSEIVRDESPGEPKQTKIPEKWTRLDIKIKSHKPF